MHTRRAVTAETLAGVAGQLAGLPASIPLAAEHADEFEPLMAEIEKLRSLPIKDIAPPLVFLPEPGAARG